MPRVPKPNFWDLKRECYRITFEGPNEDAMTFHPTPFSSLKKDEIFTLEVADHPEATYDALFGLVAVDRLFRAQSDPFHVDDVWQIECERL